MESSIIELSKYRLETAEEDLDAALSLIDIGKYKSSLNRSYYAIFHALRSVNVLDGFDSSKHSGVISFFNRTYVKTGVFDKSISKMIDSLYRLREKADYQDFYIVSKNQAVEQAEKAKKVLEMIKPYVLEQWGED